MNALNDQATSLEGSEVQQFADQVTAYVPCYVGVVPLDAFEQSL